MEAGGGVDVIMTTLLPMVEEAGKSWRFLCCCCCCCCCCRARKASARLEFLSISWLTIWVFKTPQFELKALGKPILNGSTRDEAVGVALCCCICPVDTTRPNTTSTRCFRHFYQACAKGKWLMSHTYCGSRVDYMRISLL